MDSNVARVAVFQLLKIFHFPRFNVSPLIAHTMGRISLDSQPNVLLKIEKLSTVGDCSIPTEINGPLCINDKRYFIFPMMDVPVH